MSDENSLKKIYRPCVAIVLFNSKGQVFVGERIDTPGAWQMPQGGIDEGEDIQDAAFRELQEEIGTNKAEIIKISNKPLRYDLPENLADKLWQGQYAGQEQTWIAMKFTGQDEDINLENHQQPEFSDWQWIDIDKTLDVIVPFKKDVYKKVIAMFSNLDLTG